MSQSFVVFKAAGVLNVPPHITCRGYIDSIFSSSSKKSQLIDSYKAPAWGVI
ncbi:hypothetical protein AVEN_184996-1, partial [Araneus ventricosus]